MALVQRLPVPSWDEEVVPALRKRLESESRTLSKRMSAISLSADDIPMPPLASESTARPTIQNPSHIRRRSSTRTARPSPLQMENSNSGSSASTSRSNPNSAKTPVQSSGYQRSRTYSQPDAVHQANGLAKMGRTGDSSKSRDPSRSRPSEPKPTRIPKPSRAYGSSSNGNTPVITQMNGFSIQNNHISRPPEDRPSHFTSSTTGSTVGLPNSRSTAGLMNESPPFPTSSSVSTLGHYQNGYPETEEYPSRPSTDSEEQPFEHWYRGEVSRNGGVGELRVGRQQEMLEIANYGHMLRAAQRSGASGWSSLQPPIHQRRPTDNPPRHRKRAGSIAGLTEIERNRGSVLIDEDSMNALGRVLDEHPLTDLEGEESDIASLSSHRYRRGPDYIHGVGDISTSIVAPPALSDQVVEDRSTTPQPALPTSRNGVYPATRIPSRSTRRSSESRSTTPTASNMSAVNGSVISKTPSPPLIAPTTSRSVSGQSISGSSSNVNGKKRVSPSPLPKKRTPLKSLRNKQAPALGRKDGSQEGRSVSQYPSPGDGEDMVDAIPTWTQAKTTKEGNWDEVVLPVVARQKGLDDYYQTADGSPQPKPKTERTAPAPGTFGYDGTKYRRRGANENIPMDEFGRPEEEPKPRTDTGDEFKTYDDNYSQHHQMRRPSPPPSPAPFAHYAPPQTYIVNGQYQDDNANRPSQHDPIPDLEEKGAGCCKCTIM